LVIFLYDRTFVSGTFRNAWRRHGWLHLSHASTLLLLGMLVYTSEARGGSVGPDEYVTHWNYLCTQAYAVVRYAGLSLWPAGLTFDYGAAIVSDARTIIFCGSIVFAALSTTLWALKRKPLLGFLGAWYFILLAPSSSFIPVNSQTMADHRMYLPLAAIVLCIAFSAFKLLGQRSWILLVLLVVPAATATVARNQAYLSEISLWTDNVKKAPANYRGWISLSTYHLHIANDPAAAAKEAEIALRIRPNYQDGLNCLGVSLVKLGRRDEGLALVEKSLLGHPASPTLYTGAGAAYQECGLYEQAISHFNKVLAIKPSNSAIHYNLAICLMQLGHNAEAEQHFRQALESNPRGVHVLCGLGGLLQRLGRTDEAIVYLTRAVGLDPQSSIAHGSLGATYMSLGNAADGLRELREAVQLDPKSYERRASLCHALAYTHRNDEAIPLCEALIKEKPDAELFNNLGGLYGETGQLEKAAVAFQAALQIDPNNLTAQRNYARAQSYIEARRQH